MATMNPWEQTVEEIVQDWPEKQAPGQQQRPKETAQKMRQKYGEPDEATSSRLVWHENGPWKRTVVHRDGPKHNFPVPHVDHLEQTIDYGVPPELFDELGLFDGSVYPDRTRGELTASCHKEEANILALNLAHDVITGSRTVEEARDAYGKINAKLMAGSSPSYATEFQFSIPRGDLGDPDVNIATEEARQNTRSLALAGLALATVVLYAIRQRQRGGSRSQSGSQSGSGQRASSRSGAQSAGSGSSGGSPGQQSSRSSSGQSGSGRSSQSGSQRSEQSAEGGSSDDGSGGQGGSSEEQSATPEE